MEIKKLNTKTWSTFVKKAPLKLAFWEIGKTSAKEPASKWIPL